MPDPIYAYAAIGFVVGVIVGLSVSRLLLYKAESAVAEARRLLNQAVDKEKRATAFYENAARESESMQSEILDQP